MYADIVPDNYQMILINLRDRRTRDCWKIADITEEILRLNQMNGKDYDTMQVYAAVGMFTGKASRTIREYYSVGRLFDPEIRENFQTLSFDHFRIAARLGPEKAILALQWASEQVDQLNRPCSVDAMEAQFLAIPDPVEPEVPAEDGEGTYKQIYRLTSQILNLSGSWEVEDEELQEAVDNLKKSCIETLHVCERVMADER